MPFYEVIYETGAFSVACYADDYEATQAVAEQHRRAIEGEPGGPTGHSAERIVKVLVYDAHPQDAYESQAVSVDAVKVEFDKALADLPVGDLISVPELTARLRDLTSPTVDSKAHESNYKAKETREMELVL